MPSPQHADKMSQFTHVASGIDHRWGQRVPVDLPLLLLAPGGARWEVRLRELSISGALVATSKRLPEMTRVEASIHDSGNLYRRRALLPAYVARCMPQGMALCWMDLAPAAVATLVAETFAAAGRYAGNSRLRPHELR